jgi:dnd system-associated protein 4
MTKSSELRIRRPKARENVLEALTNSVFDSMYETMVFSACLGFHLDKRVPFQESGEPIRFNIFVNNGYGYLPDLLALATKNDAKCLAEVATEERLRLFEEFANGGLLVLAETLDAFPTPIDAVISAIQQAQEVEDTDTDEDENIAGIISDF